jgi:signal transduction histidine kinase
MLTDHEILLIEYERLRSVQQQAPLTFSVSILNTVITAFALAPVDGVRLPIGWVAATVIVSAVRWIGGNAFMRRPFQKESCRRWALFSVLGALTSGILWGTGATVLFPTSEWYQVFLTLVVGGMCAGALSVHSAHLPTAVAFILPASLPLAACFFAQGPAWRGSALMVVIFASALPVIGLAAHRMFGDRIKLQIALDQQHRKLLEANQRLLDEAKQRRMAEATLHQAQKMEAIGHLTGGIAHDFNNLLQVMIGNMDLIRRLAADNPRVVKYAEAAEQAAQRGAELTGSLLTFARRQTLEAEPVDINALLHEFAPILTRTLGTMVQFDMVLAPDLPACVADAAHFQSAVLNLVINARDAMPEGGVLSVCTGVATLGPVELGDNTDARPGGFVSVSVRDTGCGMSPDVLAKVFEPFFTTKEIGKGTGLGLPQVYGFARQSGGHVELVSTPNQGTVATLWLPVTTTTDVVTSSGENGSGAADQPQGSGPDTHFRGTFPPTVDPIRSGDKQGRVHERDRDGRYRLRHSSVGAQFEGAVSVPDGALA